MGKGLTKILIIILSIGLQACKQELPPTQSAAVVPSGSTTSSSCAIGKWTSINPTGIELSYSSEFTSDFTSTDYDNGLNPLEQSAKNWNSAISSKTLFKLPLLETSNTGSTDLTDYRDNEFGIYKSHTWFTNVSSSALAITQYYGRMSSTGSLGSFVELSHADIIFNYRDFGSSFKYKNAVTGQYDIQTVLFHELGHFLGLCHDSSHLSVMRPFYNGVRRFAYSFDEQKITDLYINDRNTLAPTGGSQAVKLPDGVEVVGRIELHANGECKHYKNGKLDYVHKTQNPSILKNIEGFMASQKK